MAQPPPSPMRAWLVIALAFTIIWVGYLIAFGPLRVPGLDLSPTGRMAAYDWTLSDLDDLGLSFSRYKGKTVFLNIWATWCGPCIAEMPSIARLAEHERLRGKPIEFVCVSTDDSSARVKSFLENRPWTMTFLRAQRLPAAFLTDGIPATFIIARDGRIAAAETGATNWDSPKVIDLLEKLAAE